MELQRYWAVIWKWIWLIIIGMLVSGGISYFLSQRMEPVYRATTTLLVQASTNPISNYDYNQPAVATHAELIRKESVMEEVINELGLPYSPGGLRSRISTRTSANSPLIKVSADDGDPVVAQEIADTTVAVYIQQHRETVQAEAEAFLSQIQTKITQTSESADVLEHKKDTVGLTTQEEEELAFLQNYLISLRYQLASWNTDLVQAIAVGDISVGESASLPTSPVSPKTTQNVILASMLGLVATTGGAFLKEYLDRSIKTGEDVSLLTGLSTLGAVPKFKTNPGSKGGLITEAHPRSSIAESFRMLRTNLQFATVDKPAQTLLITGPGPAEGKTSVLANLAVTLAQTGKKVIAVDTDLRRSRLHEMFDLANTVGFSNLLLAEQPDVVGFLQATKVEGLRVLTAGPSPHNPADLLSLSRMSFLIEKLRKEADVILFDSAPVLAVADATIMAPKVDGVILVVLAGHTRPEALAETKNILSKGNAHILGVVLNAVEREGTGSYYYYHYRNSYYYGEGEGEEKRHRTGHRSGMRGFKRFLKRFSRN
jgi:capsular exopolysaccharide synthesis family protein